MARFQREPEVLASLNHPNFAQIYGIEEANGLRATVMELVENETLAEIIARGRILVEAAIRHHPDQHQWRPRRRILAAAERGGELASGTLRAPPGAEIGVVTPRRNILTLRFLNDIPIRGLTQAVFFLHPCGILESEEDLPGRKSCIMVILRLLQAVMAVRRISERVFGNVDGRPLLG